MTEEHVTDADVDELIELMGEAASAYIGGDARRYFELMQHADDFTLMDPFGGDISRESGASEERLAALKDLFKGGEATLEVIETYASGEYPTQDWSLRVTLVFRREASTWRLVHRQADALVHPITFDQLAQLARGD